MQNTLLTESELVTLEQQLEKLTRVEQEIGD